MAYEVVMPYHLHMPSYFLETFTEYPLLFASNLRHQMQQNAKTKRFLSIKKAATCFVTA